MIRVSHPPTKPSVYSSFRFPVMGITLTGTGMGMWWGAAHAVAATSVAFPGPTTHDGQLAALGAAGVLGLGTAAAAVRHHRWSMACEDQKVYEAIARVLRIPLDERARMKVRARDGLVPSDVRVRVDSVTAARDERVRKNLVRAFADATGEPVERVRTESPKRAVRVWVERPAEVHEPAPLELEDDSDHLPEVAPVPARPVEDRTQERITAAMRGALSDKGVEVQVTDTHDNGAPAEVWITYPPALTSTIGGALQSVRDTMERVHHARNDEWSVRWVSARDLIVLADRKDPLAPVVPLPRVEEAIDLHAGPVIGITEAGEPWRLPLMGGPHTLVGGATGAGKGSIVWGVIRGVSAMASAGLVRLWVIDPKGGMELGDLEGHVHRFAVDDEDCIALLQEAVATMKDKAKQVRASGQRKVDTPTRELPLDLIVVDELAALTDSADTKVKNEVVALTSAIMRQGRAPAVTLLACTQDPRVKVVPNRAAYTQAVALRLSEAADTNMILGQGVRAQGALADLIPVAHPGIGYVTRDGRAEPVRFRAAFVGKDEIDAVVTRLRPPLDAPQIGAPIEVAEQPLLEAPPVKQVASKPSGRPVRITALNDLPRLARFDGDPDPVTILGWENSPDEDDWIRVTYTYGEGEPEKVTDMDESETVTLMA